MTSSMQDTMRRVWLGGQRGCLPGKEQARIWALRECGTDEHDSEHGMHEHIRHKVHKVGAVIPQPTRCPCALLAGDGPGVPRAHQGGGGGD